jgi:hypothetical protein
MTHYLLRLYRGPVMAPYFTSYPHGTSYYELEVFV